MQQRWDAHKKVTSSKGVFTEYIVDNGGVCRRHIYAGMNGP